MRAQSTLARRPARRLLAVVLGAALTCAGARAQDASPARPPTPERPPNIVLVLADDLGYECLGANGGTSYATPHLDRLAAGGMRFTHCYSQPSCTPTRVQLMTGLYNSRNYTRFGQLPPGVLTFAHALREAGYRTGIAGKWQLGNGARPDLAAGFDEYCIRVRREEKASDRPPGENRTFKVDGELVECSGGEYGPDFAHAWLLDFVERHEDVPFFAYYTTTLVHPAFAPTPDSPDWGAEYVHPGKYGDPAYFPDMVAYLDGLVGSLATRLDELGLAEDTLLIFTGDNGTPPLITSRLGEREVRGGKGRTTDAGTHVPLLVRWPGTVPAGSLAEGLVDFTDFFPTLLDVAGVAPDARPALDGVSLLPTLRDPGARGRDWIYSWNPDKEGAPKAAYARTRRYKLYDDGRLFDLEHDPEERHPLPSPDSGAAASEARRTLRPVLERYARP